MIWTFVLIAGLIILWAIEIRFKDVYETFRVIEELKEVINQLKDRVKVLELQMEIQAK